MAVTEFKNLEVLGHALVLLQEICQGYDNSVYRGRAKKYIIAAGNRYIGDYMLPRWAHGALSTPDFIAAIEEALIRGTER